MDIPAVNLVILKVKIIHFSEDDFQYTEQFRIADKPSELKSPREVDIDLGITMFDPSMYKANRQVQRLTEIKFINLCTRPQHLVCGSNATRILYSVAGGK